MAKLLTVDEVLIAAIESGMPQAETFRVELENIALRMGDALAKHLEVDGPTEADFFVTDDKDGGGVLVGFAPREAGQPVPNVLAPFDASGEWEPRESRERQGERGN